MIATSEVMVNELITRYQNIMKDKGNQPDWAIHKTDGNGKILSELISSTIPFVGAEYYKQQKKILVYASAENLSDYYPNVNGIERKRDIDLNNDKIAINRHRWCFEHLDKGDFFPNVHIQPMDDGGLATAIAYLTMKLTGAFPEEPRSFYETIAFGNYAKYTIETGYQKALRMKYRLSTEEEKRLKAKENKNTDYTQDKDRLKKSYPYIKADIDALKPDYVIMPHVSDYQFIESIRGNATIICINQINSGVINRTIALNNLPCDISELPESIRVYYDALHNNGINGKTKEHYLSVFTYLDKILSNI